MNTPERFSAAAPSWLPELIGAIRELVLIDDLDDALAQLAQVVADQLGFDAVALNVTGPDGELRVDVVAGPAAASEILGSTWSMSAWLDVLNASQPWGALRVLSHHRNQSLWARIAKWPGAGRTSGRITQPADESSDPNGVLLAPLTGQDGSLLGVLSVDLPSSGSRPDPIRWMMLELLAAQAATTIKNAHARRDAESLRRRDADRWLLAFEHSPLGAAILDADGGFVELNDSLAALLGYRSADLMLMGFRDIADPQDLPDDGRLFVELLDGTTVNAVSEQRFRHSDGHIVQARLHASAVRDESGRAQIVIGQIDDITQHKVAQQQWAHQQTHDLVTDLPNRSFLEDRIGRCLARGKQAVVVCCDVDRFKTINDSLGHQAGDQLLLSVADRLREALPEPFVLARVGGDEFVALAPHDGDDSSLRQLGSHVLTAFEPPLVIQSRLHTVSVSVGLTLTRAAHAHPNEVLREASLALYRAKRLGRGRAEVYDPSQDRAATVGDLELEDALRSALTTGHELRPYFQPIVNLADQTPVGYEALVRWRHPARGLLDPAEFLPLAEATGLIVPLGWHMLDLGCQAATDVRLTGGWTRWVAVNTSASQLGRGELVPAIRRGLNDHALRPERLHLEITETALVDASPAAIKEIREVADLGVQIALDDFGTGYSSLSLLRDLPVSAVKIDRSFIAPITFDRSARAIVRSVISLCQELDITTIAEGIETEEQLTSLRALGCSHAQGYLIGHPEPL